MLTPFFTVIIPTFNSEKKIQVCLESVLKQSYSDFEVLLIDGASVDNTIRIAESFSDDRIKIFSEKDSGIYDAMNRGIKYARGEWLYFLGSDDKLHHFSVLEEVSEDRNIEDYNVVYGSVRVIGDTTWSKDGEIYDGKFDLKKLLKKNICHQAVFYRNEFIKSEIGFYNTNYNICSDWDFNFRCWAKGEFYYNEKIIADFYGGGESTNTNVDILFSRDFNKNLSIYFGRDVFTSPKPEKEIKNGIFKSFYKSIFKRG